MTEATLDPNSKLNTPIEIAGESAWQRSWKRFKKHKIAMFGATVILFMLIVAIFAPYLSPYDPARTNLGLVRQAPSFEVSENPRAGRGCVADQVLFWKCGVNPFGTDDLGRDIMTRVMYGARVSLMVGFVAAILGSIIGTILGSLAAFTGGVVDMLISRFVEIMLSIPQLPLLLIIVGLLSNPSLEIVQQLNSWLGQSQSIVIIISVIIALSWMGIARLVRGEILSIREREYVDAAHALGFSKKRIIFRHLIPNVFHIIIVQTTLQVGEAILIESGLSFLGLGIRPPAVSWGNMLALAQNFMYYENGIFIALFPGIMIIITVLTFNFLGDGLRDALDPRAVN